jgi:hypothetical protein
MEPWRKLAIELFPNCKSIYKNPKENIWSILFDLNDKIVKVHEDKDIILLEKIYRFASWCHAQKESEPEIWTAAYSAFYEHLVEDEATYRAIPEWVSPEIFKDILSEFEDRLDNKSKYPFERPGTFADLLRDYNTRRGTNFSKEDIRS